MLSALLQSASLDFFQRISHFETLQSLYSDIQSVKKIEYLGRLHRDRVVHFDTNMGGWVDLSMI